VTDQQEFDDAAHHGGNVEHLTSDDEAMGSHTVFFGRRWDAPIVDYARQVETPTGQSCLDCAEPIEEGDRGFLRGCVRLGDNGETIGSVEPIHVECDLRSHQGHTLGFCHCTGYESNRATAKLVWERIGELRGRDLGIRAEDLHRQEETP
jgi:hypothetical protein